MGVVLVVTVRILVILLAATACGGRTDDAPPVQDAATESGSDPWCGDAATPEEACKNPDCRNSLVYDCEYYGTTNSCNCAMLLQRCGGDNPPCPPGTECRDFDVGSCFYEVFCSGGSNRICWRAN